jgi:hypothetical protein
VVTDPTLWHGLADFGAGVANGVVSFVTFGNMHIPVPYCDVPSWVYNLGSDVGTAGSMVATAFIGGEAYDAEEAAGGLSRLGSEAGIAPEGAVEPYDVGTYNELKARSVVGDQLDIHHVPQQQPAGQVIPGYSAGDAPAIALPAEEHGLIPNLKGEFSGTLQELVDRDIGNLSDLTGAPESSIQGLIALINKTYPDSLGGG